MFACIIIDYNLVVIDRFLLPVLVALFLESTLALLPDRLTTGLNSSSEASLHDDELLRASPVEMQH